MFGELLYRMRKPTLEFNAGETNYTCGSDQIMQRNIKSAPIKQSNGKMVAELGSMQNPDTGCNKCPLPEGAQIQIDCGLGKEMEKKKRDCS